MNEFIEKLIGRLEELKKRNTGCYGIACIKCKYDNECHEGEKDYKVVLDESIEIVNQLAEEYNNGWIPCNRELPPHSDDLLLIQCSGRPKNNVIFDNAFCLASYTEEGWILEMYPEWKNAQVIAWMPLPEPFKPIAE